MKKEVSLPAVIGLAIQTASVVWFVAVLHQRVDSIEKQTNLFAPQTEQIAILKTKVESIQDGITEIKGILRTVPQNYNRRSEANKN